MMDNRYYVSSYGELGEGRYDIQLLPKTDAMPGVLIELKAAKKFPLPISERLIVISLKSWPPALN